MPACTPQLPPTVSCRISRRHLLGGVLANSLVGCAQHPPPLRIGAQVWPGYELLYLARQRGQLDPTYVRLIETPSASANLRALASQALEGAALTLDEVLTARARGIKLTVVAVLDESHGADVILAQPGIRNPLELKGKRVGVESSAVGALMLDALLTRHHLNLRDLCIVPMSMEEHQEAFMRGRIDAVVTYEPVRAHLISAGAVPLFSSADIPGRIIDTLAVRHDQLARYTLGLQHLLQAHFWALNEWQRQPEVCAPLMSARFGLSPPQVLASYTQIRLTDVQANQTWLAPRLSRLADVTDQLVEIMLKSGLLPSTPNLDDLVDGSFLPTQLT